MSAAETKEPVDLEEDFASSTSLHGFNRAMVAPNRFLRYMWILAILASNGAFAYMFVAMLQDYFQYNTITDMTLEFADEVTFPAVSICNFNRVDLDKATMAELEYLSPMLYGSSMDETALRDFLDLPAVNGTGTSTTTTPSTSYNVADIIRQRGFHMAWPRMVYCAFKGQLCNSENFTHSFSVYGNCYTFNGDRTSPFKQTAEGTGFPSSNGLHLVLDVMDQYSTESAMIAGHGEVGIRVLLHDQSEPPVMDSQASAIAPGKHSFMAVRQTRYRNHVPPWGKCAELQLRHHDTYSLPACQLECRSSHVEQACQCTPYFLPGTAPPCDPQTIYQCVHRVLNQLVSGELRCDCPIPCTMTKYGSAVTYSGYPNRITKKIYNNAFNLTPDYIRENGIVLDVYYDTLNYQKISQLKAVDSGQLASNMGGMMGLFIGASVMTILEVAEYLGLKIGRYCSRRQRPLAINVEPASLKKSGDGNSKSHNIIYQ
ncbi:acid-sensing ion channel 4-B-like isoform X1 [Branchiostoma floridae]|uniref:Acid-sensing ion channel 4-B-like isoform X1 n=1 Tax=Branchiostoma floridae TaxID=7739 RepID=A0A9J7HR72_BRAFL|nr:acid-sensing ion channel 4-B-like isoform X1 [Branchiostoma floridae]